MAAITKQIDREAIYWGKAPQIAKVVLFATLLIFAIAAGATYSKALKYPIAFAAVGGVALLSFIALCVGVAVKHYQLVSRIMKAINEDDVFPNEVTFKCEKVLSPKAQEWITSSLAAKIAKDYIKEEA